MDGEHNLFAIIYRPGPNFEQNQQGQHEDLDKHNGYVKDLRRKGQAVQGGSYGDRMRGSPVIKAKSESEAQDVAAQDPAVKSGVLQAVVLPWNIVFGTKQGI